MALPQILMPAGTPPVLANGHGVTEDSVFARTPLGQGHARSRRVYTVPERTVAVAWRVSAAQMIALDDWFENALQAGSQYFAVQVADQSAPLGVLYWKAKWLAPWQADPQPGGDWRVTGSLKLFEDGSAAAPVSSMLGMALDMALTGSAALVVNQPLGLDIAVALAQTDSIAPITFAVALL